MTHVLQTISRTLRDLPTVSRATVAANLSGAIGERVVVTRDVDGRMIVVVPISEVVSSGLRVAESIVEGVAPILTGTKPAVENACRRIAKRAGANLTAQLIRFDHETRTCVFEVKRASS